MVIFFWRKKNARRFLFRVLLPCKKKCTQRREREREKNLNCAAHAETCVLLFLVL